MSTRVALSGSNATSVALQSDGKIVVAGFAVDSSGRCYDFALARHNADGSLDTATASMAKYWLTDLQCRIIDRCLQLHGGYGYMNEFPIARMFRDARVERIYGGTNEIMKVLIARTL